MPGSSDGVYSKDCYADGHEKDWLLVATNPHWSANRSVTITASVRHRRTSSSGEVFLGLGPVSFDGLESDRQSGGVVSLTYSLLQLHLLQQGHQELNRRTTETTRRLLPDGDRVIIYCQQYFAFFTLLEHTELTLSLEGKLAARPWRRPSLAERRLAVVIRESPRRNPYRPAAAAPAAATGPLTSESLLYTRDGCSLFHKRLDSARMLQETDQGVPRAQGKCRPIGPSHEQGRSGVAR